MISQWFMLCKLVVSALYCMFIQIRGWNLFFKRGMPNLDVEALDIYANLTSASMQLINDKVPWRGGRENNSKLMQNSIEALTILSFVVHDTYTSIGWFMTYSQNVRCFSLCSLLWLEQTSTYFFW